MTKRMVAIGTNDGTASEEEVERIYQDARLAMRPMLTGRKVTQQDVDIFALEQSINWAEDDYFGAMRP